MEKIRCKLEPNCFNQEILRSKISDRLASYDYRQQNEEDAGAGIDQYAPFCYTTVRHPICKIIRGWHSNVQHAAATLAFELAKSARKPSAKPQ